MLAGLESPDSGRIDIPKAQRVGYLPQFGLEAGAGTVRDEAHKAFGSVLELRAERGKLEGALERKDLPPEEAESLLSRHDRLEQEIRRLDGYEIDRRVDRVLRGLGFSLSDFDRRVTELSGGWQMRVALARLLLESPDVLLLDEPTNHLDLEAREWLEGYLKEYPGSFVLVSHDRYFLDVTVTRITDIMSRKLIDYAGNYSKYLVEREARYELALKAYERQQEEVRRVQLFIDRFRYKNTKAAQVQSRIRTLEKMTRLEPPVSPARTIRFRFPQPGRIGRIALELAGVDKSYGALRVFRSVSLKLERGQKVALAGPNGAGKSTLMRILAGTEPFETGVRTEGLNVRIDHFAQDQADRLPPVGTILDEALARSPVAFVPQVRGLLGAFLFSGDSVDKKISVLSGGERNRLALALMLLRPGNVLLLDEPTNHLDMAAKDVLLEALRSFEGTLVFVSHDRYFLSGLANRVIEVGGGTLRDHPGDYESYLWKKERELAALAAAEANGGSGGRGDGGGGGRKDASPGARREAPVATRDHGPAGGNGGPATSGASPDAGERETSDSAGSGGKSRKSRRSARRLRELESKIAELEERKGKLEALLAREDLYRDQEKSSFYLGEYNEVSRALEEAIEEWAGEGE
jgi:ATP-binding cassette subfamily F protein 3